MKGNNDVCVRRVMETREHWQKIDSIKSSLFDFKWTPYSNHIRFEHLGKHGERNLVNHFEYHGCLSQKDQLFLNLQKSCENTHKDVFDLLPITFVIDYSDRHAFEQIYDRFSLYFNLIEKHKAGGHEAVNAALASHPNFKGRSKHSLNLRPSMCDGHNLWVLKPNNCNRGRGVHIFSSMD